MQLLLSFTGTNTLQPYYRFILHTLEIRV